MKRFPALFTLVAVISLFASFCVANATPFAQVANSPGSKCSKAGLVAKSGSARVKCVKTREKLLWKKVPQTKVSAPAPSVSPSAKPPSGPTQTPGVVPAAQNEYQVNAQGRAWSWSFSYQLEGSKSVLVSDSSHSTVLFLPQGKLVHINLKSSDVSHGFWIPGLGIEKEASPDSTAKIDITAEKAGIFPGACNIQCGRGHTGMKLSVEVVTEIEYLKYLSTLK